VAESDGSAGTLAIKGVNLWQPLAPYLYDIKATFGNDVYTLPYGVRTVRVDGTKFLINEKPFYFKGYGKHEDTFPTGRGINMPMNSKDISLMKWQGANSFRTSHYPYSEEMMRLCDREGIVVIDETPAVGISIGFGGGANFGSSKIDTFDPEQGIKTFEHHKEVLRDLIARDKNYACVVMWSIANEPDSGAEGAYAYFAPLYELALELDPQKRPRTIASVQMAGPDKDCSAKLSDVICLNRYYGWYFLASDLDVAGMALRKELEAWAAYGKPVVFTEYGADTVAGLHDTVPTMFTEEFQVEYYKMNHQAFDAYPFVVGEQAWNFADFATSQSIMRVQGNKKGIFTRDRRPKLAAHYFRNRWKAIPEFGYKN
jgi:beta-glucuronidase